jgi:PAS domain S-box-containing protein
MQKPAIPDAEAQRLNALATSGLLSNKQDKRYDRFTQLAARVLKVPIALFSLVDRDTQWFRCEVGLGVDSTPRDVSFCAHAVFDEHTLVVPDASKDPRFSDNPLVVGSPFIRAYAGAPVLAPGGEILGTLCVIDRQPRDWPAQDIATLEDLAFTLSSLIADDAHMRNRRRAELVIEGTRVGTWEWNVQTGETLFNKRWAEIAGYTLAELEPVSIDTWMALAHPEDLAESERLLKAHFAGESNAYDCRARMRHKAGHWVWVHDRGKVFEWTEDGQPLLMYGTHADITEEVEAQQALRLSLDQHASLVANMPGATYRCVWEGRWRVDYLAPQVEGITGYRSEELLADPERSFSDLLHPEDAKAVRQYVADAIRERNRWRVDYRIRHRDGQWRFVEERGQVVSQVGEEPVIEGIIIDVTSEHRAKEASARNQRALNLLNDIAFNQVGDLNTRINNALAVGRAFLGMEVAILSEVDGNDYTVRWCSLDNAGGLSPGQRFKLADTYCSLVYDDDQELAIEEMRTSQYHAHPCYQLFQLESYIGMRLVVDGKPYGTVNFSSSQARQTPFDSSERTFVRLLARWLADLLQLSTVDERFRKLAAEIPGMIYQFRLYPDGRMTFPFSSAGIYDIYGLTPGQAAIDGKAALARAHPDDAEEVLRSINRSRDTGELWSCQYRVRSNNGWRWVWGQAEGEQLADGSTLWHGYIRDIDEAKRAELELEANESRFRALFDLSPIGIALNDFDSGDFLEVNEAVVKPTGYSREEFLQLSYWDLTPRDYESQEDTMLQLMIDTGRYGPYEKEYVTKAGERYPVRLQGILTREASGRQVIWSFIEDVSEQRKLSRLKDQFISTVSHELRTPLTSISGALGLVFGGAVGELPEKATELLSVAQRNSQRLTALINDLLDIEKLVAGRMPMTFSAHAVPDVVLEAMESNQGYAKLHDVELSLEPCQGAWQVRMDRARFMQVMANLISNAVKFSSAGGCVELSCELRDESVLFRVRDFGSGVPEGFREKLFSRFAQADAGNKRKVAGTGLGLAISQEIVHQMGGEIAYQAAEPGSVFWFTLPLADTSAGK